LTAIKHWGVKGAVHGFTRTVLMKRKLDFNGALRSVMATEIHSSALG